MTKCYAAPYVTGIASKLWEKDKECSRDFIRAVLDISANLYGNEKDYGYGLVDYAYAEKVYEALKPMMGDEQQFNEILEYAVNICGITNPSTVPVMDKTEDMVEGAWSQDNHQLALSNITLTSDRGRRLLLAGCIISDNDDYAKLYSMKKHPYFHGYYRYIGDEKRGYTNYIAGSLYLTKVAEAMMQGKLSSFYTSDPLVDIDGHQLSRFINNISIFLFSNWIISKSKSYSNCAIFLLTNDRTAAKTDSIVVATHDNNLVSWLWLALETVALYAVAYAAGKHDNLVVCIFFIIFLMFESQYRTTDQWLAELVTEVGSTVRSLDKDLFRSLVQPFANREDIFPFTTFFATWIRSHVHSCTGDRP